MPVWVRRRGPVAVGDDERERGWRVPVTVSTRNESWVVLFRIQWISQATGLWVCLQAAAYSGRMPVAAIMLIFKVPDDHSGFEQGVPVGAVEALLAQSVVERFDVAVVPRLSG